MDNVNTGESMNTGESKLKSVLAGPANFAQEMRSAGIHLGMGRNPVCVTCGEPWPCSTEQEARRG